MLNVLLVVVVGWLVVIVVVVCCVFVVSRWYTVSMYVYMYIYIYTPGAHLLLHSVVVCFCSPSHVAFISDSLGHMIIYMYIYTNLPDI